MSGTTSTVDRGGPPAPDVAADSVEVVSRSIPRVPSARRGWHGCVPAPHGMSVYMGEAVGRGPDGGSLQEHLASVTARLVQDGHDAAEVVDGLHQAVADLPEAYASLIHCDLDPATRRFTVVQAGHAPPLALCRGGSGRYVDGGRYPPLGLLEDITIEPITWLLPPRTTLLLFSQSLIERRTTPPDVGLERLRGVATDQRHLPLSELLARIEQTTPAHDDLTLVGVRLR